MDYFGEIFRQYTPESGDGSTTSHIFAGNLRIASVKKSSSVTKILYYHKDHLGSTRVTTTEEDGDGEIEVVNESEYLPYGYKTSSSSSPDYLFTDQEFDNEVGLYNFKARMYDPMIGRFTTADSIVPDLYSSQSLNRYSYCVNNPIKYIDPSGHSWKIPAAIAGSAALITVALPIVAAVGLPAAVTAAGAYLGAYATRKITEMTLKKAAFEIFVGVTAIPYAQKVNKMLQEKYGANRYVSATLTGASYMFLYSIYAKNVTKGAGKILVDVTEGATRSLFLEAIWEHVGEKRTAFQQGVQHGIRMLTGVVGWVKYPTLWAGEYISTLSSNDNSDLNSAFNSDLTGFSESTSKGIDSIRTTFDFSEYTESSAFSWGRGKRS